MCIFPGVYACPPNTHTVCTVYSVTLMAVLCSYPAGSGNLTDQSTLSYMEIDFYTCACNYECMCVLAGCSFTSEQPTTYL